VLREAEALGVMGVAAPSATLFGRVSPTTAAHVASEFGEGLLIVDGGACEVGIESTIVDCTRGEPVLLRPGLLTPEQLEVVCGVPVKVASPTDATAPRASGTLASHYAPKAQVRLMSVTQMQQALQALARSVPNGSAISSGVVLWTLTPTLGMTACPPGVNQISMPSDPVQCAHVLFAQLRTFDDMGFQEIWVEQPPVLPAWAGVLDRLTRAAATDR
jgi:L-threonylcarbamoyladenylate synthase